VTDEEIGVEYYIYIYIDAAHLLHSILIMLKKYKEITKARY